MILEICALAATIAFIALVIFLIKMLIQLQRTLHRADEILKQMDLALPELLENTNNSIKTVHDQIRAFNPLISSVEELGTVIQESTENWSQRVQKRRRGTKADWSQKIGEFLDLAALGAHVWQKYKSEERDL